MAAVLAEAFTIVDVGERATIACPALHRFEVFVDAMVLTEPVALARVLGEHFAFALKRRGNVHDEIGADELVLTVESTDRVHEIEVGDGLDRGAFGAIVRDRRAEAGVTDESADGFVVAEVIDGRGGQNDVRTDLSQEFDDTAARRLVIEDTEVAKLEAAVVRADAGGGICSFAAAERGSFFRPEVARPAVARRERRHGDLMAGIGEQREGSAGEDFNVVGMGVECEDAGHVCFIMMPICRVC